MEQEEKLEESKIKIGLKIALNRVKLSNFISLLVIVGMIIVFSLWSIGWNPNKIGWEIFVVNLAFLIFLGIYGLFFGETTGGNYYRTLVTGAYQAARENVLDLIERILEKGYSDALPEYITWRYQRDYIAECNRVLLSVRIFNSRILELSNDEIERLHESPIEKTWGNDSPYPGKVEHFLKLSDPQYEVVKAILNGEVKVDYIDDYNFYFMDTKSTNGSIVTKIKTTEKRKIGILWGQRLSKIALIALFAIIGAGVAVDNIIGQGGAETFLNLMQRLAVLTTSILCGFNTARILNLEDVDVFKYKSSYLSVFYSAMENKQFVPTDYEELARKEYELHQREKEKIENNQKENEVCDQPLEEPLQVSVIEEKYNEIESDSKGEETHE